MSRDDYYREIVENNFNIDKEADKRILAGSMMEAVENQLKEHEPAFVLDIFLSLQRKGYNRKQARTVIASVLIEEMYHILKDQREFDEKKYEADLKKRNRMMTKLISVPEVTLDVEEQINSACRKIYDAISDNDEEEAAVLFLAIWPVMKEYVIHNLYRDGVTGIEKPDIMDVSEMTEYNMDFDSLLPEIGIILCNTHKYEKAIDFSREVLELFSWQHSEPDSYKDDIGQALADMGRENESDAWYQRWLDEEPDNGNCINGYAFCHQIRGDIEGALAIVEEHLRVNESVNLKYYNLYLRAAELYNIIGDMQKASHYSALMEKVSLSKKDVFFAAFEEMGCSKPLTKEKKIYPNDPCLCGSGKKYKKCCGKRCNN